MIGTISIRDTRLTMFGGSVESEMAKVMIVKRKGRRRRADEIA